MKKTFVFWIAILFGIGLYAQEEFKPELTIKFPFKPATKSISADAKFVVCSDNEQVALIETTTGKVKWQFVTQEKFGFKKADLCLWDKNQDSIYFYYKENNVGKFVALNKETGEVIPGTEKAQLVKSNSKGYRDISHTFSSPENGVNIKISYTAKLMVSSASSSEATLKVTSEGKYSWAQTLNAKVMRTLYSNSSMTRQMADYLTEYVQGDKLFIVYDGFSVLDITTGKILWEAGFDYVNFDFGLTKCTQEYPKAPFPYLANNVVYVNDMHKEALELRALDANSGNIVWKSEKFEKNALISNMFFVNNMVINQFGGRIFRQVYKAPVGSGTEILISENSFPADGGFKCYDSKSGKLLWSTFGKKEFSGLQKRSTNALLQNNTIFVATEKELLLIDAASGSLKLSVPLSKSDIGSPSDISFLKDNIFIQATEGFAMFSIDGKPVYSTPTKEVLKTEACGDIYIVWIGDNISNLNTFLCFNPSTGKVLAKMDDTAYPYFTPTGNALVKFNGNKEIIRYKIF